MASQKRKPFILCVDDNVNLLSGLKRALRSEFEVVTAASGEEALALVENAACPYDVFLVDMKMPGMDGITILEKMAEKCPQTSRIMLTGNADQETAINSINKGKIFRFLTKPVQTQDLIDVLNDGVAQHRLLRAEKELLTKTLKGSINMLFDVLAMADPMAFQHASRLSKIAVQVGKKLNVPNLWKLEIAARLSFLGFISLPKETLSKLCLGLKLTGQEEASLRTVPQLGRDLIHNIPRMDGVANIIYYTQKNFDGTGVPNDSVSREDIPIESRIIHILNSLIGYGPTQPLTEESFANLESDIGKYDPAILAEIRKYIDPYVLDLVKSSKEPEGILANIDELSAGHVLLEDVTRDDGHSIFSAGMVISDTMVRQLIIMRNVFNIQEPIRVKVEDCPAV